jgi:hypothetical protein
VTPRGVREGGSARLLLNTHPGRWSAVQPRGSREASHGHALRRRRHQHRRRRGRAAVAQDAGCARRLGDGERQRSARATRGRCTAAEHAGGGTRQPPARAHRHAENCGALGTPALHQTHTCSDACEACLMLQGRHLPRPVARVRLPQRQHSPSSPTHSVSVHRARRLRWRRFPTHPYPLLHFLYAGALSRRTRPQRNPSRRLLWLTLLGCVCAQSYSLQRSIRCLNRILFDAHEVAAGDRVVLKPDDARAVHIRQVLSGGDPAALTKVCVHPTYHPNSHPRRAGGASEAAAVATVAERLRLEEEMAAVATRVQSDTPRLQSDESSRTLRLDLRSARAGVSRREGRALSAGLCVVPAWALPVPVSEWGLNRQISELSSAQSRTKPACFPSAWACAGWFQTMRVGVVNGAKGHARVLRPHGTRLELELQCDWSVERGGGQAEEGPAIDLLLAAPRPKRLKALLPVIAQV